MSNRILGASLVLNTDSWVRGVNRAVRSLASMEYVAGRTASKLSGKFAGGFQAIGYIAGSALTTSFGAAIAARSTFTRLFEPMLKAAEEFDFELRKLFFFSGLSAGDEVAKGLKEKIRGSALASPVSEALLTGAMSNLIRRGVDPRDVAQLAIPFTQLIEASFNEMDPTTLSKMIGGMMNKFGDLSKSPETTFRRMGNSALWLNKTTKYALEDIRSIMASMNAAPAMFNATSIEQWGAILGLLGKSDIRPLRVGMVIQSFTQGLETWNNALLGTGALGKKAREEMEKYMAVTGQVKEDFYVMGDNGQLKWKAMTDVLGLFMDGLEKYKALGASGTQEFKAALGGMMGRDVVPQVLELIASGKFKDEFGNVQQGIDAINYLLKDQGVQGDLLLKGSEAYRASWKGIKETIESAWAAINSILGEQIQLRWVNSLEYFRDKLQELASYLDKNPKARAFVVKLIEGFIVFNTLAAMALGLIALVGTSILYIIPMISSLTSSITAGLTWMAEASAFLGVSIFEIAGVFAPILGGIALAIGGLILISGLVTRIFQEDLGGAATKAKGAWAGIKELATALFYMEKSGSEWGISKDQGDALKKTGALDIFKTIVSYLTKMELAWKAFKETVDFSGLDKELTVLVNSLGDMFDQLQLTDVAGKESIGIWKLFGMVLGWFVNGILFALTIFVVVVRGIIDTLTWIFTTIKAGTLLSYILVAVLVGIALTLLGLALIVTFLTMLFIFLWVAMLIGPLVLMVIIGALIWYIKNGFELLYRFIVGTIDLIVQVFTSLITGVTRGIRQLGTTAKVVLFIILAAFSLLFGPLILVISLIILLIIYWDDVKNVAVNALSAIERAISKVSSSIQDFGAELLGLKKVQDMEIGDKVDLKLDQQRTTAALKGWGLAPTPEMVSRNPILPNTSNNKTINVGNIVINGADNPEKVKAAVQEGLDYSPDNYTNNYGQSSYSGD